MTDRLSAAQGGPPPATISEGSPASARAGLLALGTVLAGLLNYVYALGMTHALTREQYAVFAAGQGLILVEGVIGSAGVAWVLAQAVSRATASGESPAPAVNFTFWVNMWAGVAFAIAMGGIALTFGPVTDAGAVAATGFTLAASSTGLGFLQGSGRTERIAALLVAEVVVKCATGVLFVAIGLGSVGALLGNLCGALVPFASLPFYARYIGRPTWRLGDLTLWRSAGRISGLQGAVGVASTADAILVAAIPATAAGAAAYQAAATLGKVPLYLSTAMGTAAFPLLDGPGSRRVYAQTLASYTYLGLFCVISLVTVPKRLMSFIFNQNFADTVHWLPLAALLGLLIGLFNIVLTCDQAHALSLAAVLRRMSSALLIVAAAAVGGYYGGIRGLVLSASAALALVMACLAATTIQRGGVLDAAKNLLLSGKVLLLLLPCYLLLDVLRSPFVWLATAAVLGVASLAVAFPELRPRVLRPKVNASAATD